MLCLRGLDSTSVNSPPLAGRGIEEARHDREAAFVAFVHTAHRRGTPRGS
jgi:hypothetical protein